VVGFKLMTQKRQKGDRYLAHETWRSRTGLWSVTGMNKLKNFVESARGGQDDTVEYLQNAYRR